MGFEPDGNVRYQYRVGAVTDIATDFIAEGQGDLDEDGNPALYTVSKAALTYPKVVHTLDDF